MELIERQTVRHLFKGIRAAIKPALFLALGVDPTIVRPDSKRPNICMTHLIDLSNQSNCMFKKKSFLCRHYPCFYGQERPASLELRAKGQNGKSPQQTLVNFRLNAQV